MSEIVRSVKTTLLMLANLAEIFTGKSVFITEGICIGMAHSRVISMFSIPGGGAGLPIWGPGFLVAVSRYADIFSACVEKTDSNDILLFDKREGFIS